MERTLQAKYYDGEQHIRSVSVTAPRHYNGPTSTIKLREGYDAQASLELLVLSEGTSGSWTDLMQVQSLIGRDADVTVKGHNNRSAFQNFCSTDESGAIVLHLLGTGKFRFDTPDDEGIIPLVDAIWPNAEQNLTPLYLISRWKDEINLEAQYAIPGQPGKKATLIEIAKMRGNERVRQLLKGLEKPIHPAEIKQSVNRVLWRALSEEITKRLDTAIEGVKSVYHPVRRDVTYGLHSGLAGKVLLEFGQDYSRTTPTGQATTSNPEQLRRFQALQAERARQRGTQPVTPANGNSADTLKSIIDAIGERRIAALQGHVMAQVTEALNTSYELSKEKQSGKKAYIKGAITEACEAAIYSAPFPPNTNPRRINVPGRMM